MNIFSVNTTDKWNISCHISKQKGVTVTSYYSHSKGELVNPEGTQEGEKTYHLAAIRLQSLPQGSPEGTQDVKTQDSGPK